MSQSNVTPPVERDLLNQCQRCGIRGGKYTNKVTGESVGVFLLSDSRGFKICNVCRDDGYLVGNKKMNKSEKRKFKQFKREVMNVKVANIRHITLDAKGKHVL